MLLCLLIVGTLFQTQPVFADETLSQTYDPDRTGSIKVCLDDIGTPRDGVSLYCYKIGSTKLYENNLEGFFTLKIFESLQMDLNNLGDIAVHRAYADSLVSFIETNPHIKPEMKGTTDAIGECTFGNLEQGVYLVVQKDSFDSYGTTEAFLMTVPYMENDQFIFDIVTQTKGEKPVPPTETETSDTEPGDSQAETPDKEDNIPDKPAKTGDSIPIFELTVVAFLSALCIAAVVWYRNRKKNVG